MNNSEISRKIFFWTLVVIFWFVSAIIVSYAFGYRFSFEKGVFVYAGSITLKTTPQEVSIYLNGNLMPSPSYSMMNNSYHLSGIKPGEYFIEIKAPKYQTWSKKISVHSGISTEFWNIVLAEKSYEREDYSDSQNVERFFISPHKNLLAFSKQNNYGFDINVLDPKSTEINQVFSSTEYSFTDDKKENIEWSPQAHSIIIPAMKDGEKNYFIVNIDAEKISDLKTLSQASNLTHVRWDPKNKDVIFYMSNNDLYRMDLNYADDKKIIAQNIGSYDLSQKALFYFKLPEGIVYKINFDKEDEAQQITTSAPSDMSNNSYQIIVYDDDRMVFLNNKNNFLYVYNKGNEGTYFQKLSEDAQGSQFSDDGKKLLYWTNNEIFTYFVRKWEVPPTRIENENMPITRLSDPIKNVQWTRDYEHVLFTNDKKLKLIEIDNRDHRNTMDIISFNEDDPLLVDNFTDGRIYFTDRNNQAQNFLHAIYFPARTTLLEQFFPNNNQQATTN